MLLAIALYAGAILQCAGIQLTPAPSSWEFGFCYHDHDEMTQFLRQIVHLFPDLTSLYSIGRSVQQRELWVLKISAPPTSILGTPNVKFLGNIHGNEPVGQELILHMIKYLVVNYQTNEEVKSLLDSTVIHMLPSLNPDGFAKARQGDCMMGPGRENSKNVDLNRSFPDFFRRNKIKPQPETEAVMDWLRKTQFVLSASLHGGALVANYPFENSPGNNVESLMEEILNHVKEGKDIKELLDNLPPYAEDEPGPSLTPDDDVFQHLARTYARNHPKMHKGQSCRRDESEAFPGGITNGAAWYPVTGGMQDYNYVRHGCMELTLEISCCKYPLSKDLERFWEENRKAMLELAKQAKLGLRGIVMDAMTGDPVPNATLRIAGRQINFSSSQSGEYWRILLPGFYTLEAEAEGYQKQTFPFTIKKSNSTEQSSTWLNVYLKPEAQHVQTLPSSESHKFESCFRLWLIAVIFVVCR